MDWIRSGRGIFGGMGVRRESEFLYLFLAKRRHWREFYAGTSLFWNILICESRTPQHLSDRLDSLIDEIHAIQSPNMRGESPCDIVLLSHGHLLRAFVKRWLKYPLDFALSMMMLEPGGVGILGYQEHDINQPAFFLGMGFPLAKAA